MNYAWAGKIRELENILERTINLMDDDEFLITPEALPPVVKKGNKVQEKQKI